MTMRRFVTALILFRNLSLGCTDTGCHDRRMVYGFDNIEPSADLTWEPCFDGFKCSRLQVPLDYSNKSLGNASIAFIKLEGKNATSKSPSILLLPGGPGGSGVDLLLTEATVAAEMFGGHYSIVSFDPRGVNNSGPSLNCFSGNPEARQEFYRLHNTGIANISSTSLEDQYYSSSVYGEWCNHVVQTESPFGYYVTTPAVARDLLTFIEAEAVMTGRKAAEAKLWAYGISYGTVTGATFASMFPDRVERMILDGVVNAELYYHNDYTANLDQMDEAIGKFVSLCHSAGPERCSFWGPTPENITGRLDNIIQQFHNRPVPISGAQTQQVPTMVTYADLKTLFLNTIYLPIAEFPVMADILHQVEQGNVSALAQTFQNAIITDDANHIIQCADAYRTNSLTSIEDFKDYVEYATHTSKYIGDLYPIYVDTIVCRSFRPHLPDSMVVRDPMIGLNKTTFFPIVFASNTIDPITPLISAQKSSSRFPGSVLLLQEAIGHTVVNQGASDCYIEHVQAYFRGTVPTSNTTCAEQYIPFIDNLL
ncbi:alpha/beta-hydrolase [Xylona heveae TC161]|uniref:Alpha/beta-hydrolase n=1 Tax=Xylona heveae (strain CBS 132557 / TC161) TaxID=1328760 RepID=A0A164ZC50_XYLHT|nr:alpha/beta-hydrolase [Xylona heveae TC161]KZF18920.1 alpha/beta-hydrolase [Xylona heveae TC161]